MFVSVYAKANVKRQLINTLKLQRHIYFLMHPQTEFDTRKSYRHDFKQRFYWATSRIIKVTIIFHSQCEMLSPSLLYNCGRLNAGCILTSILLLIYSCACCVSGAVLWSKSRFQLCFVYFVSCLSCAHTVCAKQTISYSYEYMFMNLSLGIKAQQLKFFCHAPIFAVYYIVPHDKVS